MLYGRSSSSSLCSSSSSLACVVDLVFISIFPNKNIPEALILKIEYYPCLGKPLATTSLGLSLGYNTLKALYKWEFK